MLFRSQKYMENEENTVLFSTHITQDLEAIADYIIFIDDGKLIQFAPMEEFINSYKIIKGSLDDLERISKNNLLGYKKSSIGFEALISKTLEDRIPSYITTESANIEKIMVLYRREG